MRGRRGTALTFQLAWRLVLLQALFIQIVVAIILSLPLFVGLWTWFTLGHAPARYLYWLLAAGGACALAASAIEWIVAAFSIYERRTGYKLLPSSEFWRATRRPTRFRSPARSEATSRSPTCAWARPSSRSTTCSTSSIARP